MAVAQSQKCLECKKEIHGRADKRFCSDSCRNTYNNRLNSDTTSLVRNINNRLRKNRRILASLCPDDTRKTHYDKLLLKGYDFNLMTHQRTTKKGDTYVFVYDYGILELENDFYLIVKNNRKD